MSTFTWDKNSNGSVDTTAIHKSSPNEISTIAEKTAPHNDDLLLIEDSENSGVKKKLRVSNLPSGGGGGGGEANTTSSAGIGSPVTKTKSGVNLPFKSFIAGSNKLTIANNTDDLTLDVDDSNISITESQISNLQSYILDITGESLSDLNDVTINGITTAEILKWNGSAWINNTLIEAGIAAASHVHAASDITSGTLADARIAVSNVTQHQASLSLTESQISDLRSYSLSSHNHNGTYALLSHNHSASEITSGSLADARIQESNVTQHEGAINHNSLLNYVGNQHIDHASIDLSAGIGLSGGGDISASRTFNIDLNSLTTTNAESTDYIPFVDGSDSNSNKKVTVANLETIINHDNLTDFVSSEHADHNSISMNTGANTGLSGGGTIAATRNLSVDIDSLSEESGFTSGDFLIFHDTTAGVLRKVDYDDLPSGGGASEATPTTLGTTTSYISTVKDKVHTVTSANYTILDTDGYDTILVSTGASDRTIALPTATDNDGRELTFKKTDSGSGQLIIDGEGSETIDGQTTQIIHFQYGQATIICDGTSWFLKTPITEVGSYTPTYTNITNMNSASGSCNFQRTGNLVTVFSNISWDASSGGGGQFNQVRMTLPIEPDANFSDTGGQCVGIASGTDGSSGSDLIGNIVAYNSGSTNGARIRLTNYIGTASEELSISFTYRIYST